MNWQWISRKALELLHDASIAEQGGLPGLRDESLFESALARPENLAACGEPDLAALAAAYAVGLAKGHPFADGNKRVAFLPIGLFLMLSGQRLVAAKPKLR